MSTVVKLLGSLFVGVVGFLAVGIGVTEALDPYVWPSLMLGLPAGLVAGVALALLAFLGLTYREEVAATGRASERTMRRLRGAVGGILGFVAGGGIAMAILWTQAVGLATAMLFGGLPVGIVVAALAAFLAARRGGADRATAGSPPANSP